MTTPFRTHYALTLLALASMILAVQPIAHADEAPAPQPVPQYRVLQQRPDRLLVELPNRMLVLAQQMPTAPVVSAQVWVKTGSIYEQEHVGAGLSHFLEHLLSGGTTANRSEDESNAVLARIGAETNAATSLDNVHYYINTTSQHTPEAIGLLSDWMQNSLITQQEYERERSVIQREFEMGEGDPGRVFWKLTQQARYTHHPARHPTIGYLDEFRKITRDEIYDFYKRMYVPNNMVFVVVGDVDKQQVVDQVAKLWNRVEPGDLPKLTFPVETEIESPRQFSADASVDQPRLRLAWPGTQLASDGDFALDLLATILGQGESSRLNRTVRDDKRLVNTIAAYNLSFTWGQGFFAVDAAVAVPPIPPNARTTPGLWRDQHIDQARQAILDEAHRLAEEGPSPAELDRAKRAALVATALDGQSAQDIADRYATDLIGMHELDYLDRYAAAIQNLAQQDVRDAAKRFLNDNRLITLTLLPRPQGQPVQPLTRPPEETSHQNLKVTPIDLDNQRIVEDVIGKAASPTSARAMVVEPIKSHILPNGLRLLIGRSTVVPGVAIQFFQLGGLLADAPGREGFVNAVINMQVKGTATRTAQQIAQQVEDLGAQLDVICGNNTDYIAAECLSEDWPKVLELLADVVQHPVFPEDEWQKLRPRLLAAIDRQTDSWYGELSLHFRQAYFGGLSSENSGGGQSGGHPWSQTPLGKRDVVEALTVDDLRKFHRERLGASQSVLVVFGDMEPEAVIREAGLRFAGMPDQPGRAVDPPQTTRATPRVVQVATTKGLAAVEMGYGPVASRTDPDYAVVQVLARVMSNFPSGRLERALRGRGPGLVYAVWAGPFTGLVQGYFAVIFNTQPGTVPEAIERSVNVVQQMTSKDIGVDELRCAQAKVLADEFLGKQSNSQRAMDAALNALYGLGVDEPRRFLERVQQVTVQEVREAAERYLHDPVTVVLTHDPVAEDVIQEALGTGGSEAEPKPAAEGTTKAP